MTADRNAILSFSLGRPTARQGARSKCSSISNENASIRRACTTLEANQGGNMSRRIIATCATASLSLVASLFVVTGQAAAAPADVAGRYCYTEVAPISPGSRTLDVVSTTCSDRSLPGSKLPDTARFAAAQQLLVIFHENTNYGGNYDTVGGDFGPCDREGYGFRDLSNMQFNTGGASSYEYSRGSNCRVADYWTDTDFTGTPRFAVRGNKPFVGSPWNDDIFSMRVRA